MQRGTEAAVALVLGKRCSENMLCNFIKIALRHGCSPVNLLHIVRTPFLRNTSRCLLLEVLGRLIFYYLEKDATFPLPSSLL